MGRHKLLLPLGDRPVIAHVGAAACASSARPVLVVVGHEAERVLQALPAGDWHTVLNSDHSSGMASSLRAGIAWLESQAASMQLAGALILLGDQPLVTAVMIEELLAVARAHPEDPCAASFGGERRSPVYFPRGLFGDIHALEGDAGGRSILIHHAERLRLVPLEPVEAALDVDSPEEYERVRAYWQAHFATGAS
jgi:molybdenum cofactor cytidylyltransferase